LSTVRSATEDPLLGADADLLRGAVELVSGSLESAEQVLLGAARDIRTADAGRALQLLVIAGQAAALADHTEVGAEIGTLAAALPRSETPERSSLSISSSDADITCAATSAPLWSRCGVWFPLRPDSRRACC
jgi:hypothetical protein